MPPCLSILPAPLRRAAAGLVLASAAAAAVPALADTPAPAGVLQRDAQASAEVVPDRTVARLAAVAQGDDLASLNAEVARRLEAALRLAHEQAGVQASTGEINTRPQMRDDGGTLRQHGWVVTAVLSLRAADPKSLGGLLGQLGQTLQLQSVQGEMSSAQRQRELDQLSARAIAAFRARAASAARDFGYAGYSVREVQLSGLQGTEPQPRPLMLQGLMAARAGQPAVAVEPGSREVSVSVSGSVQLQR